MQIFFNSKYYSHNPQLVESMQAADTEELWRWRADYMLHADFQLCGELAPLTLTLFKGQLHTHTQTHEHTSCWSVSLEKEKSPELIHTQYSAPKKKPSSLFKAFSQMPPPLCSNP